MKDWSSSQLTTIADAQEVQLAVQCSDATLRSCTIWGVRVEQDVFVRSAYGAVDGLPSRALGDGSGRLWVAGVEWEVTSTRGGPCDEVHDHTDAAHHVEYDRCGAGIVVGAQAAQVTVCLSSSGDCPPASA